MSKEWIDHIEKLGPGDLIEVPDPKIFYENEKEMSEAGFNREVFVSIFPIMEQQIWSLFRLFQLAKKVPEGGTIIEIGSGRGGSISTIGTAAPHANLINIDKFGRYDEETAYGVSKDYHGFEYNQFKKNVEPFNLNLKTLLMWSDEAASQIEDGSADMIFVDGNHSYVNCKSDIQNYEKKVKPGGIFCGHDYHPRFPGVIKAVKEIYGDKYDVLDNSSIWVRT